jgi:dUTP pyrophosphatase
VEVKPYSTELIPTGIRLMSMPKGYELQVRPRSGVSLKTPLRVANSPGTIDSDYRGEIKIIMTNTSGDTVIIPLGERIAQLVPQTVPSIVFESSTEAEVTTRGAGGFGSTGQHV